MDKNTAMSLLEARIRKIVRQALSEASENDQEGSRLGDDKVASNQAYKRQYMEVEKALSDPTVNATQVMSRALDFDASDDTERSHAFKKLHKEKGPNGGVYKFKPEELPKILANLD